MKEADEIIARLKDFISMGGSAIELAGISGLGHMTIYRASRGEDCRVSTIDKIKAGLDRYKFTLDGKPTLKGSALSTERAA